MISLCFSGILFGLVAFLVLIIGVASLLIVKFSPKYRKDRIKIHKVAKIFTLSVAYYGIAITAYLLLISIFDNILEYTTCSGKESIEFFVIFAYIMAVVIMMNSIKNSKNTK